MDLGQPFGESEGRCRQSDGAWGGELFHARRQVRGLPHGRVVHMQVVANGPHHHFAGIEPHPRLHLHAVGAANVLRIAAQRRLNGQGGVTGPCGVILVSHRGAEERHDAIA